MKRGCVAFVSNLCNLKLFTKDVTDISHRFSLWDSLIAKQIVTPWLLPGEKGLLCAANAREKSCWLNRGELWFHQKLIGLRPNVALGENNFQWNGQYGKLVSNAGEVRVCAQLPHLSHWKEITSVWGKFSACLLLLATVLVSLTHLVSYAVLS